MYMLRIHVLDIYLVVAPGEGDVTMNVFASHFKVAPEMALT